MINRSSSSSNKTAAHSLVVRWIFCFSLNRIIFGQNKTFVDLHFIDRTIQAENNLFNQLTHAYLFSLIAHGRRGRKKGNIILIRGKDSGEG